MVCHLHSNWEKLFFKLNECYLLSIELLQFCPPMILVLLLNSYAVWRSNWYFHINFSQICEHFWQLLKLLKIASLTLHVKYVGTFPVIIISKTGNLPPPTLKQCWILSTMGGNESVWCHWCHNIVQGEGGSWAMKRWTQSSQSRSKKNIVVRNILLG